MPNYLTGNVLLEVIGKCFIETTLTNGTIIIYNSTPNPNGQFVKIQGELVMINGIIDPTVTIVKNNNRLNY